MEFGEWVRRRRTHFCRCDKGTFPLSHWPSAVSLLMLGTPGGGGGAGVLLEGLGEGGLLRVA